mmetsp:Transcript_46113/g.98514  ORF Transcript_46113/g.98514 Transcript_46113/m.98514 type:complete len:233 (-) Transcript_46113:987-1685(-)
MSQAVGPRATSWRRRRHDASPGFHRGPARSAAAEALRACLPHHPCRGALPPPGAVRRPANAAWPRWEVAVVKGGQWRRCLCAGAATGAGRPQRPGPSGRLHSGPAEPGPGHSPRLLARLPLHFVDGLRRRRSHGRRARANSSVSVCGIPAPPAPSPQRRASVSCAPAQRALHTANGSCVRALPAVRPHNKAPPHHSLRPVSARAARTPGSAPPGRLTMASAPRHYCLRLVCQ